MELRRTLRESAADLANSSGRIVNYIFSTPGVARDGNTIALSGWHLDNFEKYRSFQWAHDLLLPPIGRVVDIGVSGGALRGSVEYADADLNPFADMVFRMVRAGFINSVSVSWLPIKFEYSKDRNRPGGIDFLEQELLEVSQAPVPADPNALATARSAGIDTRPLAQWAKRKLDQGGAIGVQRRTLETIYQSTRKTFSVYDLAKRDTAADRRRLLRLQSYDSVRQHGGPIPACFLPPADNYEREARRAGALLDLQRGTRRASAGLSRAESNSDVASDWKCAASHGLPVATTASFDADAAAARIFAASGFDTGTANSVVARQGFLFYDAAAPGLRDSYLLPFADMIDGTLTATKGGIAAAAAGLPKAKVPDSVKDEARGVIDHYQTKMEAQEEARSIFAPIDHARKERERRERLRRLQNTF
jgi:hypothetical protein